MEDIGPVDREAWISHLGKKVLLHDYSGLHGEAAIAAVVQNADDVINRGQRNLLILVDVTDAFADRAVLAAFKKHAARNKDYVKKAAVVGAVGVTLYFLDLVSRVSGMSAKPFRTEAEALDWLTEE